MGVRTLHPTGSIAGDQLQLRRRGAGFGKGSLVCAKTWVGCAVGAIVYFSDHISAEDQGAPW